MAVEGIPQRDVVVTFSKQFLSYYEGEQAGFTEDEAARLVELGAAALVAPPEPPPPDPEGEVAPHAAAPAPRSRR